MDNLVKRLFSASSGTLSRPVFWGMALLSAAAGCVLMHVAPAWEYLYLVLFLIPILAGFTITDMSPASAIATGFGLVCGYVAAMAWLDPVAVAGQHLVILVTALALGTVVCRQRAILGERVRSIEKIQDSELIRMNKSLELEIRAHTEAEAQLRESEEKYKNLVNSLPEGIFIVQDSRIVFCNPGLERLAGRPMDQLLGENPDRIFPGKPAHGEPAESLHHPRGGEIFVETQSVDIRYKRQPARLVTVLDITEMVTARREKERLKTELEKARKMEAFGLLAGGVAHDLNNVLSGIVSTPELILMDLPADSELIEPVMTMKDSGKRASIIVDELLTLARGSATITEPVQLNDIIEDYLYSPEYAQVSQFHPRVRLSTVLDPELPMLTASGIHMRKVVMNLVSNAMEAIRDQGEVILKTASVRFKNRIIKGYERTRDGEYVCLSVRDTGQGISKEDMDRIFEPFYTKKVLGRSGTGLGLSIVWNTVHDHKGYIRVSSGRGHSLFELFFPAAATVLPEAAEPDRILTLSDYSGNGETILVVDDVAGQRKITTNMLKRLGYRPMAVKSGEAAIEYVRDHSVDLVILDMIMDPGISGLVTFQQLRHLVPEIRAIIASGYSETEDVQKAQALGAGAYIKKPFSLQRLGLAVKAELNQKDGRDDDS